MDPAHGDDANPGSIDQPLRTLQRALSLVAKNVADGQLSDKIVIERNLFFDSGDGRGTAAIEGKDPQFADADGLDFRPSPESPAVSSGPDIGAYDAETTAPPERQWWRYPPDYFTRVRTSPLP